MSRKPTTAQHVLARQPRPPQPEPVQLCAHCGDPIRRFNQRINQTLGIDTAWLDTMEAVDPEAYQQLRNYLGQLATLWWWTHWAMDGSAKGTGIDEVRTHQRGGDPTGNKIRDGKWDQETGEQFRPPGLNDKAAEELRGRCRKEAKRLRDAAWGLQRYLANLELATSPNLEREQRLGLRDETGRLIPKVS